jgi:hypothetical protein
MQLFQLAVKRRESAAAPMAGHERLEG